MENIIDFERLRNDLIDYFGTGMVNASNMAIIDLIDVSNCSNEKLLKIAIQNNFDLDDYRNNNYRIR